MLKYRTGQRVKVSKDTDRFKEDIDKIGTIVCICSDLYYEDDEPADDDRKVHIYKVLEDKLFFNGMGCLAAQIVAHFKENSGGYYIFPIDSKGCGQEYIYTVYNKDMKLFIKVEDYKGKILFDGSINEFSVELCKENKNYADKPKPTKQD